MATKRSSVIKLTLNPLLFEYFTYLNQSTWFSLIFFLYWILLASVKLLNESSLWCVSCFWFFSWFPIVNPTIISCENKRQEQVAETNRFLFCILFTLTPFLRVEMVHYFLTELTFCLMCKIRRKITCRLEEKLPCRLWLVVELCKPFQNNVWHILSGIRSSGSTEQQADSCFGSWGYILT